MDITGEQTSKKFVMSDALLRQRRNLIVTAVIAIMLRYGGVEISKVGALGTELTIANKSALYVALWLTLFYFILRYYQYLMYEMKGKIKDIYILHVNVAAHFIVEKAVELEHKRTLEIYGLAAQQNSQEFMQKQLHVEPYPFDTAVLIGNKLRVKATIGKASGWGAEMTYDINRAYGVLIHATAVLGMIFTRPIFTDLAFPFVLAAIAICYGWDGDWDGSILHTAYVLFN